MTIIIDGNNTPTAGGASYGTGTSNNFTAAGTTGQVLTSQGASAPVWGTATVNAATGVTGTLPIANGGTGTTSTTFVNAATNITGTLPIANGGTNSLATPTAGGAVYGTGTAHAITAAGTAGQVLTSAGASAPTWSTPSSNLVLISTTTATAATTTSIAIGASTGTYSQYRIVCNNFMSSAAGVLPALRIGTPTEITSGYNSGGYSPTGSGGNVNRNNTNYFYLTNLAVGTAITGSLIIDITQPASGQYGIGIFASTTFDYGSDGSGMSTSNFAGGIGTNGSSNISIIITDRSGTSPTNWITGTFKLYGIKA